MQRGTLGNNRHNVTLTLTPKEYCKNNRNINRWCYGYNRCKERGHGCGHGKQGRGVKVWADGDLRAGTLPLRIRNRAKIKIRSKSNSKSKSKMGGTPFWKRAQSHKWRFEGFLLRKMQN